MKPMDKGSFIATCLLGLGAAAAVFFPLRAKGKTRIPLFVWWLCVVSGSVVCIYGLTHSTTPSFAPRITALGKGANCIERDAAGSGPEFFFRFAPEGGQPVDIWTQIIMPHWGNAEKFEGRRLRIVYLNAASGKEAIDIEILSGDNAGWRDALDARPFGIWLAIPIGAAISGFGVFGIRFKKDDVKTARASETSLGGKESIMNSPMKSPASMMRVLKLAFVASAFLFILVVARASVQPGPPVSQQFQLAVAFVGFMCVLAGFLLPQFLFRTTQDTVQNLSAAVRLKRWMAKSLMSLAFFEACILFGLTLHFLHGSTRLVEILFGVGIAAELFWSPGTPSGAEDGVRAQG